MDEVTQEAERINRRFADQRLAAHRLHPAAPQPREILPYYRSADVCLVTSLHDGMNLVAKEFVAARADEQGALILSRFTGAATSWPTLFRQSVRHRGSRPRHPPRAGNGSRGAPARMARMRATFASTTSTAGRAA